ncbi:MAG: NUDIX domain-containing protein [Actinomycetota bacterium]|nr:NUDIX domain-containing protein [Actinomycetota bacterium]
MTQRIVVAAAILLDGRVLGARRAAPPAVAGQWEFPGGKVEPGESDHDALVRECREELGLEVAVGELVGTSDIGPDVLLRVYLTEHLIGFPEPRLDHDETRWFAAEELDSVQWLAADVPLLAAVAAKLTASR